MALGWVAAGSALLGAYESHNARKSVNSGTGRGINAIESYLPKATDALGQYYGLASASLSPYTQAGASFLPALSSLFTNPQSITQQPGYQFQMSEGLRGIGQHESALGKYFSGQSGRAMEQYAAGQAGTSYLGQLQTLGGLTQGIGLGSANTLANIGMQTGSGLAGAYLGTGQNIAQLYGSQGSNLANMQSQQGGNMLGMAAMATMFANK